MPLPTNEAQDQSSVTDAAQKPTPPAEALPTAPTRGRKAIAIAGATSVKELSEKAAKETASKYMTKKAVEELAELAKKRHDANLRLAAGSRRSLIAMGAKFIDPLYYDLLKSDEIISKEFAEMNEALASVYDAWGIEMTGKWTSIVFYLGSEAAFLGMLHATVMQKRQQEAELPAKK